MGDVKTEDMPRARVFDKKTAKLGVIYPFDPKRIKRDPRNPRKRFRGIPSLAESIRATGQTTPGKVTLLWDDPDYDAMLVDGERRVRACEMAEKTFDAYLDPDTFSPAQRLQCALAANFNQEPHDRMEIAQALQDLIDLNASEGRSISHKELGRIFGGKSDCWVSQHLSLLRLHPSVQEMLIPSEDEAEDVEAEQELATALDVSAEPKKRRKHIPFVIGLLLVNLPHEDQIRYAKRIIDEGMSLVKARRMLFKEAGKQIKHHQGRSRSPGEASEAFGNKIMTIQELIGLYIDMPFPDLEHIFSTRTGIEVQAHVGLIQELIDDITGLGESLSKILKKKIHKEVAEIAVHKKK